MHHYVLLVPEPRKHHMQMPHELVEVLVINDGVLDVTRHDSKISAITYSRTAARYTGVALSIRKSQGTTHQKARAL